MLSKKEIKQKEKELGLKPGRCGSGWNEWVVPDRPFWMWFISLRLACRQHDIEYEIGGTETDRENSDINLYNNILIIYRSHSVLWKLDTFRTRAFKTADLYFDSVRKYGKSRFNYKDVK